MNIKIFFWVNKYHSSYCRRVGGGGGGGGGGVVRLTRGRSFEWRSSRYFGVARATTTEVGFPPDFFPSTNRFL